MGKKISAYDPGDGDGGEFIIAKGGGNFKVTGNAPKGPVILDANGKILSRLGYEGVAGGVAVLDSHRRPIDGSQWETGHYEPARGIFAPNIAPMIYVTAQNATQVYRYGHQGIARDNVGDWYSIDTQKIYKISSSNDSEIANGHPGSSRPGNHYGDGQVLGDYLYVPYQSYNNGQPENQELLRVNTSDLSLSKYWALDTQYEAAGVALYGDYVYVASYQTEGVYAYRLTDGEYLNRIGPMRLTHRPRYINGIAVRHGRMVLWGAYTLWFYRLVSPDRAALEYAVYVPNVTWSEGVIWDMPDIIIHTDHGDGTAWRYTVTAPTGIPSNLASVAPDTHGLIIMPPPTGQLYMRANFPDLPGTRNIFDSPPDQDTSEMWIYSNGRINAKIGSGTTLYGTTEHSAGQSIDILLRWWRALDGTVSYDLAVDGISQGSVTGNAWRQMEQWYLPSGHKNSGATYTIERLALYQDLKDHSSEVFG